MDLSFLCLLLLLNSLVQSKHPLASNALGDVVGVLCHHGIPGIRIVRRKIAGFKAPVAVSELIVANKVLRRGKGVPGPELLVLADDSAVLESGASPDGLVAAEFGTGAEGLF